MSPSRRRHLFALLAVLPLLAATAGPGWYSIHARLGAIDDEGYVMASVRSVMQGHALYDEVFSHYGPFAFLSKWVVLSLTGLEVTHDTTRLMTLCIWVLAATGCGLLVLRHTRSLLWGLGGYILSFLYLAALVSEPGHPQEQGVLLVVVTLLAASSGPRGRLGPWLTGAGLAAAALVKVNVGVFLGLGLAAALADGFRGTRGGRVATAACTLAALLLGPVLLLRDLATPWGAHYALAVGTGIVGAWGALLARAGEPLGAPYLRRLLAAAAVVATLTVAFVMARGTSLAGLVDGFLLRPLAFADAVFSSGRVPAGAAVSAGSSLLLAAVLLPRRRRPASWATVHASLAVALGLVLLLIVVGLGRGPAPLLFHLTPFLWIALLPTAPEPEDPTRSLGLRALVLTAAVHALVAYPIYGSQRVWATFLIVPIALIALHRGLTALLPAALRTRASSPAARAGGVVLLYAVFFTWFGLTNTSRQVYMRHYPLDLPGARHLRVPFVEAGAARWTTGNLRAHGDAFYSLPGLNAFSFFTGQEPVTQLNVNYWMVLLTEEEQRHIIDELSRVDRLCILVSPIIRSHWERHGRRTGPMPLVEHIERDYTRRLARSGFEIRTRPDGPPLEEYLLYGQRSFDGRQLHPLPLDILTDFRQGTVTGWMRTTAPGVVLGAQDNPPLHHEPTAWAAWLWVGEDGHLHAAPPAGSQPDGPVLSSDVAVDDGRWHHWALVAGPGGVRLHLDGRETDRADGAPRRPGLSHAQLGLGRPAADGGGWVGLRGDLADVSLLPEAVDAAELASRHDRGRVSSP